MARQEGAYKFGKNLIEELVSLNGSLDTREDEGCIIDGKLVGAGEVCIDATDRNTTLVAGVLVQALWDGGFIDVAQVIEAAIRTYTRSNTLRSYWRHGDGCIINEEE